MNIKKEMKKFIKKNSEFAIGMLLMFLDTEIKEYTILEINKFLLNSEKRETLEGSDFMVVKEKLNEVIIFSESNEEHAMNPEKLRINISIPLLQFFMNRLIEIGYDNLQEEIINLSDYNLSYGVSEKIEI